MSVPKSRILDLMRVQCRLFNTTFNPTGLRLGGKVLRQRLKGPSMAAYYPRRTVMPVRDLERLYPDWEVYDWNEFDRLEKNKMLRARGKGTPKKKTSAADSKRFGKKRQALASKG